jgi:hypothetical protein
MAEVLFTYYEDTELSLRTRLAGYDVRYVPSAVARHRYEFGRHPAKLYLLERNRLATLLTVYERRTLILVLPMLVLQEGLVLAMAVRDGWLPAKVRGWWWLARNAGALRTRRRLVQQRRRVSDAALVPYLSARIEPSQVAQPVLLDAVNAGLEAWWRLVAPRVGHDRTVRPRVMADARDATRLGHGEG